MSRPRQEIAIADPPADLSGFPTWRLRASLVLMRAHRIGVSPWWFSSNLSGRFDLLDPCGTCYLATDTKTALRERFGHDLVEQGIVTFKAAAETVVSALQVPVGRWLANTCHDEAATFGTTRELGTCSDYEVPQSWASAFHNARFRGIRYQTRFTTGPKPNAVALFGSAGQCDWPVNPAPIGGIEACAEAGLVVAQLPTHRQVRIVNPPAPPL